jgi:solute carrier family 35 protein F1/2
MQLQEDSRRLLYAILIAQLLSVALAVTGTFSLHEMHLHILLDISYPSAIAATNLQYDEVVACAFPITSCYYGSAGVSSQALTNQGIYAPTTQAFLNYCLLALVFGTAELLLPNSARLITLKPTGNQHTNSSNSQHNTATLASPSRHPVQVPAADVHINVCADNSSSSNSGTSLVSRGTTPSSARSAWPGQRHNWLSFAALAVLDVEANTLVTKAYQFTSLTSVTLLDCFTIPSVMLLSWVVLRSRYRSGHFAGAACCIAGLAVLLLGDVRNSVGMPAATVLVGTSSEGSTTAASPGAMGEDLPGVSGASQHYLLDSNSSSRSSSGTSSSVGSAPLLGDLLVLAGAVLYGVSNVTQELLLADVSVTKLLAFLGMFGAVVSGVQAWLLERQVLLTAHWLQPSVAAPMAGFALAMFFFYSAVPGVLILGGAAVLNLSLLTSDAWSALARVVWFGGFQGSTAAYFAASLVLVAGGITLYALSGSPKGQQQQQQPEQSCGNVGCARGCCCNPGCLAWLLRCSHRGGGCGHHGSVDYTQIGTEPGGPADPPDDTPCA